MDREVVLAILVTLLCGGALAVAGWYPRASVEAASGVGSSWRAHERRVWRRLWLPFAPAVLVFAALCGWALVEPERAERVPGTLLWGVLPFAAVLARAAWRALRSWHGTGHLDHAMATVGLLRPRIVLSPPMLATLDQRALVAALEHERAHLRHRDPLRLWLAQLGTDLLWPWPIASARLQCWKHALELARDEEARLSGIGGADLAAAILALLRVPAHACRSNAATLGGEAAFVEERIAQLLRPLDTDDYGASQTTRWSLAVTAALSVAVVVGTQFGERMVVALLALSV